VVVPGGVVPGAIVFGVAVPGVAVPGVELGVVDCDGGTIVVPIAPDVDGVVAVPVVPVAGEPVALVPVDGGWNVVDGLVVVRALPGAEPGTFPGALADGVPIVPGEPVVPVPVPVCAAAVVTVAAIMTIAEATPFVIPDDMLHSAQIRSCVGAVASVMPRRGLVDRVSRIVRAM
jgi:hypothetical protein